MGGGYSEVGRTGVSMRGEAGRRIRLELVRESVMMVPLASARSYVVLEYQEELW